MIEDKNRPEWKAQKTFAQNRIDSKAKAALPPPTPEEEARPFAKYYHEEIKQYDPAHYKLMENPIDPASLSAEHLEEVEAFLAAIDANDDVQNVFVGLAG